MVALGDYVGGFLIADGYRITSRDRGRLIAERQAEDGIERRIVWFADPDHGLAVDEVRLLAAFRDEARQRRALDQAFFVTPSLAGLSTAFRQSANELGVGVRVPVQFFDTPYKADGDAAFGTGQGERARSAMAEFAREHGKVLEARVAQPFVALTSLGAKAGGFKVGDDLLSHLAAELMAPPASAEITIVIGHAGAGKSCLFASLFQMLSRHFAAEKRALRLAGRPILFLPDHIREKQVRSMDGLLEAVATTDAATATGPQLMRWLNANGLTIWMFDGLDEFFAGEADFMSTLEQSLSPESRSRVVICVRDSLLTTSTDLRSFVDRHIGRGAVKIYELARWERTSQRSLAWLRLAKRLPNDGEADPSAVAAFLERLDRWPALAELATLPFYCDLLLSRTDGPRPLPQDEFELLGEAIDGLIDREAQKLASGELGFDWDVFSGAEAFVDTSELVANLGVDALNLVEQRAQLNAAMQAIGRDRLVELIEGIAHRLRMLEAYPNATKGLPRSELEQMAAFYLDVGLPEGLEPRVLLALVQFAFFGAGKAPGSIKFAHEIVADFLAARHALTIIRSYPESADALGQALGVRRDLDRTIALRYLVHALARDPDLVAAIEAHVTAGRVRATHRDNARLLVDALRSLNR